MQPHEPFLCQPKLPSRDAGPGSPNSHCPTKLHPATSRRALPHSPISASCLVFLPLRLLPRAQLLQARMDPSTCCATAIPPSVPAEIPEQRGDPSKHTTQHLHPHESLPQQKQADTSPHASPRACNAAPAALRGARCQFLQLRGTSLPLLPGGDTKTSED